MHHPPAPAKAINKSTAATGNNAFPHFDGLQRPADTCHEEPQRLFSPPLLGYRETRITKQKPSNTNHSFCRGRARHGKVYSELA